MSASGIGLVVVNFDFKCQGAMEQYVNRNWESGVQHQFRKVKGYFDQVADLLLAK